MLDMELNLEEIKAAARAAVESGRTRAWAAPAELVIELIERLERAEADVRRLDSGVIVTSERDDFGEAYKCERRGLDLRAMIDEAMAYAEGR